MKAPEPKEIREAYDDDTSEWQEIREEGQTDMRFVAGDPWEAEDRKARKDAGRPCISLDELNQYLNQSINNVRQNPVAIQVIPKGDGSNDSDAEHRANMIRGIEYHSPAQPAYICGYENALQRGYGFCGLETAYESDSSFDQELRIRRFPNPDCVLIDPHYKKADASDIERAFVVDLISKAEFKRKFPKAKIQSFSGEHMIEAPQWIREKYVQIAEYWKLDKKSRTLLLIDGGESGPITKFEDELKSREGLHILKERKTETAEVVQFFTNGLEVLEEADWVGSRIPIAACFGKEIFLDDGAGAKRMLLSMVRLARDPQMLLAYFATQECEEAGQTPKSPFVGYKGQFESDAEAWEFITKIPRSFVQVDLVPDGAQSVLPLPTRPNFVPNFQAYELAKDSARRSIQAAMGISPETTAMQRNNQKSGIALEKLQDQASIGSFHFSDNYKGMIGNIGWQVNEALDEIYDGSGRTVPISKKDGTHGTLRLNDQPYALQNPQKDHLAIRDEQGDKSGDYGATVATGPSYESQREQASSFVDLLLQNLQQLPVPPNVATAILALAIRLKDIGPIGEKIAELLTPPDQGDIPPQAQAAIAQAQGMVQQLQAELAKLTMERDAKTLDHQGRIEIEKLKQETVIALEKLKIEADLAKSEVGTKAQILSERESIVADVMTQLRSQAHDVGMQAHDQQHQASMADQQAKVQAEALKSQQLADAAQPQAGQ